MILVFPEEMSISTLPACYFHELEHFSQVSSHHLTPFCAHIILNCHPCLSLPIIHAPLHPFIHALPHPITHTLSLPVIHTLSQTMIIWSHPTEPAFNPFPKIGEE